MRIGERHPHETQANAFAAEFLAPKAGILRHLAELGDPPIELEAVVRLAARFGTSCEAMRYRLWTCEVIDDEQHAARLDERATQPAGHRSWPTRSAFGGRRIAWPTCRTYDCGSLRASRAPATRSPICSQIRRDEGIDVPLLCGLFRGVSIEAIRCTTRLQMLDRETTRRVVRT